MRKYTYILLLYLIGLNTVSAIESPFSQFDRRHDHVLNVLMTSNISEAHTVADSLLRNAEGDEQMLKAYMLLARFYENSGDLKNCLHNALQADTIANSVMNSAWQTNTSIFLATTFRRLGLMHLSEGYIVKAKKANVKQLDSDLWTLSTMEIQLEECFHYMLKNNYHQANQHLLAIEEIIEPHLFKDSRFFTPLAVKDLLHGFCELNLGHIDTAESYGISVLEGMESSMDRVKPYAYILLARVYIERNNLSAAKDFLEKTTPFLELMRNEELKILVYETWISFFRKTGDLTQVLEFTNLQNKVYESKYQIASEISEELLIELQTLKMRYEKINVFIIWLLSLFIFIAAFVIFVIETHRRKYKLKLQHLESEIQDKEDNEVSTLIPCRHTFNTSNFLQEKSSSSNFILKETKISKDTELRLLEELEKQEAIHFYLKKDISLQKLATDLGTNPRYVTYIIQKYRDLSYYDYLQVKRIEYIMDLLRAKPELSEYKLSYLSEMVGFASLSKFSTAFKKVSGMPPSVFVHIIKTDINRAP